MPARLTVYPPDQPALQFPLDSSRGHLLGRGSDCDLRIDDDRLSRRHARLSADQGDWQVTDLNSKNGTTLAGREPGETQLRDGDWISFGGLLSRFALLDEAQLVAERSAAQSRWDDTIDRSRQLDPAAGVEALLAQLLQATLELAGAERGFVMMMGSDGRLAVRAARGATGPREFEGSRAALERVLTTREPVVVCDTREDTLLGSRPSVVSGAIRAVLCFPLAVAGQLTGLVYLDSGAPGKVFTRLDVEILEAFAGHAALVIGAASVREELADIAGLLPRGIGDPPAPDALLRRLRAGLPAPAEVALADGGLP